MMDRDLKNKIFNLEKQIGQLNKAITDIGNKVFTPEYSEGHSIAKARHKFLYPPLVPGQTVIDLLTLKSAIVEERNDGFMGCFVKIKIDGVEVWRQREQVDIQRTECGIVWG